MIRPLTAIEAVRQRPEFYLGPERKPVTLVAWALLDPVVAPGTHWTRIEARWSSDGVITIMDDDLSLPTESQGPGRPGLDEWVTTLYPGGPRGASLFPVGALCE